MSRPTSSPARYPAEERPAARAEATAPERPDGLPNERVARAWDDKLDGDTGSARNLKREAKDTPAALETTDPGHSPTRKSTRGSTSHLKGATAKTTAVTRQVTSASARAHRSQTRH